MHIEYYWESQKERDHCEDRDGNGQMILKWVLRRVCGGIEWMDPTRDRGRWWALQKTAMSSPVLISF